jgi:Na+/H+ antiporter NhaB
MGVTAAVVSAGVALYGIYEQSETSKAAISAQKKESDRQYAHQLKMEKELKDKQANSDALETSKIARARRQALLFGGATNTKNNTIKTSPVGVSSPTVLGLTGSNAPVGGKTLLGQ